jgi:hypothetical protein
MAQPPTRWLRVEEIPSLTFFGLVLPRAPSKLSWGLRAVPKQRRLK